MSDETESVIDRATRLYFGKKAKRDIWSSYEHVDLQKPPGFVGEVVDYINSQCRFEMLDLSVLSALVAVGNIGGLHHKLKDQKLTSNLFGFGVAGSSAGKEAVFQSFNDLHIAAIMGGSVHGTIKSEQEIVRNIVANQSSFYNVDEFGIFLRKLESSQKSGGAAYLQGVIGMLLSAYSKASGNFLLSGDVKRDVKKELYRELAAINKQLDQGSDSKLEDKITSLQDIIDGLDSGIKNPFLSINAFSEPHIFNSCVSFESVTSGFIGRALIVNETDTNPRPKRGFICPDMPDSIKYGVIGLCVGDEKTVVTITPNAQEIIDNFSDWIFDKADDHKERTGFEAVVRRGFEIAMKVMFILGIGSDKKEIDIDEAEWAIEYVKRDIEYKTKLAYANINEKTDPVKAMSAKILCQIGEKGTTTGTINNKFRGKKSIVETAFEYLLEKEKVYAEVKEHKGNGTMIKTYFKN